MNRSSIWVVNPTSTTYTSGSTISVGSAIHGTAKDRMNISGNNIQISECSKGLFYGSVSISAAGANAGVLTAQLYKNGVAVPGAFAIGTVVAGGATNLAFPFCIRKNCCSGVVNLSIVVSNSADGNIQVSNVSIMVNER